MPRPSSEELDLHIQVSLLAKIRHAANAYNAASSNASPHALENYLSSLESLAEYVAARWRGARVFEEAPVAPQLVRSTRSNAPRMFPFAPPVDESSDAEPLSAA